MNGAGHIVNLKKQLAILPLHPPASTSSNWAEMDSAECPNHISLEWKVAEIPLHFPVINESDVWHCAEAVCARVCSATPTLG